MYLNAKKRKEERVSLFDPLSYFKTSLVLLVQQVSLSRSLCCLREKITFCMFVMSPFASAVTPGFKRQVL